MMRKPYVPVLAVLFALVLGGVALAGNTATQTVSIQVSAINELSVSGNPAAMNVNAATAGSQPTQVTNSATTYAVTTNQSARKITGKLDSVMPDSVTLKINLTAPTGGTSLGDVTLTASDQDLVTGVSQLAEASLGITYKLSATVAAGVVSSTSRTVTLTLTASS
jgi:hypothetical protein